MARFIDWHHGGGRWGRGGFRRGPGFGRFRRHWLHPHPPEGGDVGADDDAPPPHPPPGFPLPLPPLPLPLPLPFLEVGEGEAERYGRGRSDRHSHRSWDRSDGEVGLNGDPSGTGGDAAPQPHQGRWVRRGETVILFGI